MTATIRFGIPDVDDAEQIVLDTRWGGPSAKPTRGWRETFVYAIGVTNSAFTAGLRNLATGGTDSILLDSTANRKRAITHPDSGFRANGFNAVAYWDASSSASTNWASDLESLAGQRLDLIQGILGDVDNEWLALSDGSAAVGDIDSVLSTPLARYASHPSVIAYSLADDLTNDATHGHRAGELMAAIARLDGRPATPSFLGNNASDAVTTADWQIGLFGGGGYPNRWDSVGVDRVDGDFTFPDDGGVDWAEWSKAMVLSKPATANIWWWLQAHQLGDGSSANDLHYPSAGEIRKQVWESVGSGVRGLLWFVYQDESVGGAWLGLAHPSSGARMAAVAEMGNRLTPNIRRRLMRARPLTDDFPLFVATGGGSSGWKYKNFSNAYISTLQDNVNGSYLIVVCNRSTSPASVTISSDTYGAGNLVNLETGASLAIGGSVTLPALDGTIYRFAPTQVNYWWDTDYDSRLLAIAENDSGFNLQDHVITIPIPAGTTVDSDSLRVLEVSALGSVLMPWTESGRYGTNKVNRHFTLPASTDGTNIYAKLLGKWDDAETRYLNAYWDSGASIAALNDNHESLYCFGPQWTVVITAGAATDLYRIVILGNNYDYTMQGGDTATVIAAALVVAINAGGIVTATSSTGTITLGLHSALANADFTPANTGSTQPSKVVVGTRPLFWVVQRVGPDTEALSYNPTLGVPYGVGTSPAVRACFGWNNSHIVQTMQYKVNGDATTYDANVGVVSAATLEKWGAHIAGSLTFDTRSADVDWLCTYVCDWENKVVLGRKSDDTAADTLNKQVNVFRVTMTYTCNRAYTPATNSHTLLTLMFQNTGFGGDSTIAAGNQHANWSAPIATGARTDYSTTGLDPATSLDTIIGAMTSQHAMAIVVNDVTFSDFGSQTPGLDWSSDASAYAYLAITNLSNGATIPQGASIVVDFIFADGSTNNPTTTGDGLLWDELIELMQGLSAEPSISTAVQTYSASSLRRTMELASGYAVEGCQWFIDNALTYVGRADNYGYSVQPGVPSSVKYADDNDSLYGSAHMLHGLCLRYRRTHDAALIPLIEAHVQQHLTAESEAVALYGSWWQGAAPYWFWPGPNPELTTYLNDSGIPGQTDPTDGGPIGSQTYAVGQIRRSTSVDQLHMLGHGMYAYTYILKDEAAITANTTLSANAKAFVTRMKTFEAAHISAGGRGLHNLDDLVNGAGPSHNLSITVADTYVGDEMYKWQTNNTSPWTPEGQANSTLDAAMAYIYSPDVTADSIANFIRGRAQDFLAIDWSRHDMVQGAAVATRGVVGKYPKGWTAKATVSTVKGYYEASRATVGNDAYPTEKHFYKIETTGSNADVMYSRGAQRLVCMVLGEWFKPGMSVNLEMDGSTPVRSITLREAIDDTARTLANYAINPETKTTRNTAAGYLAYGFQGDWDPLRTDATLSAYWLMAAELWLLLDSGADVSEFYRKAAV